MVQEIPSGELNCKCYDDTVKLILNKSLAFNVSKEEALKLANFIINFYKGE